MAPKRLVMITVAAVFILSMVFAGFLQTGSTLFTRPVHAADVCTAEWVSVVPALTDLGTNNYTRPSWAGGTTYPGITGDLYPNGSNTIPAAHEAAGLQVTSQIQPLDAGGNPDPNGKIIMISIGHSNTNHHFGQFICEAKGFPSQMERLQ